MNFIATATEFILWLWMYFSVLLSHYCVIVSIYTFFVLQPYAFLAHNSEYNSTKLGVVKQQLKLC